MKKLILSALLIFGMNFAYAADIKAVPITDKQLETKKSLELVEVSVRCAVLFNTIGDGRQEAIVRKFGEIADNSGASPEFVRLITLIVIEQYAPVYKQEAKNPQSALLKKDINSCPYLLYRFK